MKDFLIEVSWRRESVSSATLAYCDNVGAIYLTVNPIQHQHTKHIEIDIHFVRDMVARGHVHVLHVSSRYQYADIFTKRLSSVLFEEFRTSLSVRSSPAPTAGECLVMLTSDIWVDVGDCLYLNHWRMRRIMWVDVKVMIRNKQGEDDVSVVPDSMADKVNDNDGEDIEQNEAVDKNSTDPFGFYSLRQEKLNTRISIENMI
ncbi:ribonuclease H-like domain-containing protein [Tanacetum coccineum]